MEPTLWAAEHAPLSGAPLFPSFPPWDSSCSGRQDQPGWGTALPHPRQTPCRLRQCPVGHHTTTRQVTVTSVKVLVAHTQQESFLK